MIYFAQGSETTTLNDHDIKCAIDTSLSKLGEKKRVLVVPPDYTRFHSRGGDITTLIYTYYKENITTILPATGTHSPMTGAERHHMFTDLPAHLFKTHNWRNDVITLGSIPGSYVSELTNGAWNDEWPVQINKVIVNGDHDLILSIGQVVPHEVLGMANFNKNLLIGVGGAKSINQSHFIGAVIGMETIMGKADNPVRRLLNRAATEFLSHLPIVYVQTVMARDKTGKLVMRGLYIGDDLEVFTLAAALSRKVNITVVDKPLKKAVVFLDPLEYKSTWLGNKGIYRTRMALAHNGNLIILAPGVKSFGEDMTIDALIRKYGYKGTPSTLESVQNSDELRDNLSAAAHLIHGSSEGRFSITYCPGSLTKTEIESVHYHYSDLSTMLLKYDPQKLTEGYNKMPDGEEIFFISNPALGLWTQKEKI